MLLEKIRIFKKDPIAEALSKALRDPSHAPAFFKALLNEPLHALVLKNELLTYADTNGEPFIPVFTSAKFLPRPPEGADAVSKPGRELLELARGRARVVINAGRKEFKAFGIEDLDRILDKLVTSRFEV